MADQRGRLGDNFLIRVPSKSKVATPPVVEARRKGPYPVEDEELRPPPQQIKIVISDISTLYIYTNINEESVTAEDTGVGWAVIGRQLPSNRGGDTYGDSLVEFTEATILQSNENILRFLDSGGGG
jgi:hypothetical protein